MVEAKAATIVRLMERLPGELHITCEEGIGAAWLCDLLKPYVMKGLCPTAPECSALEVRQQE
jgi:hypothetical protein